MNSSGLPKKRIFHQDFGSILIASILFCLSFSIRLLYFKFLKGVLFCPDSYEYWRAAINIVELKIDIIRVPVYPLFIQLAWSIFPGIPMDISIALLQSFTSSLTIVLVYFISNYLFQSSVKAYTVSIFISAGIFLVSWDYMILTESLTLFLITLLTALCLRYFKNMKLSDSVLAYIVSLALVFTKPFYLFMPVLIFIIIILYSTLKGCKKSMFITGLSALTVLMLCIYTYSNINLKQNGYYGISDVNAINQLGKVMQYGMYELGENDEIKDIIRKETELNFGLWPNPNYLIEKYGWNKDNYRELTKFTSSIIMKHPFRFITETGAFIYKDLLKETVFIDYNYHLFNYIEEGKYWRLINNTNIIISDIGINTFLMLFIILLVKCIICIKSVFKGNKHEWSWIFIIIIILSQFFMSVIGAHAEYQRLMAPVYILIFLVIFEMVFKILDIFAMLGKIRPEAKS